MAHPKSRDLLEWTRKSILVILHVAASLNFIPLARRCARMVIWMIFFSVIRCTYFCIKKSSVGGIYSNPHKAMPSRSDIYREICKKKREVGDAILNSSNYRVHSGVQRMRIRVTDRYKYRRERERERRRHEEGGKQKCTLARATDCVDQNIELISGIALIVRICAK